MRRDRYRQDGEQTTVLSALNPFASASRLTRKKLVGRVIVEKQKLSACSRGASFALVAVDEP